VSDIAAFFQVVQSGDPSKVEALLDANASLANARNEKGQSAVLVAVYAGNALTGGVASGHAQLAAGQWR
jgi:ankyrin repeat protein